MESYSLFGIRKGDEVGERIVRICTYLGPRPNLDKKFLFNLLSYFPGVEAFLTFTSSIFLGAMAYTHTRFSYLSSFLLRYAFLG